jgi:hypothetical protein
MLPGVVVVGEGVVGAGVAGDVAVVDDVAGGVAVPVLFVCDVLVEPDGAAAMLLVAAFVGGLLGTVVGAGVGKTFTGALDGWSAGVRDVLNPATELGDGGFAKRVLDAERAGSWLFRPMPADGAVDFALEAGGLCSGTAGAYSGELGLDLTGVPAPVLTGAADPAGCASKFVEDGEDAVLAGFVLGRDGSKSAQLPLAPKSA